MAFILDLQNMARPGDETDAVASISTDSWFACQSDGSQIFCITT